MNLKTPMQRISATVAGLVLATSVLAGCGGKEPTESAKASSVPTPTASESANHSAAPSPDATPSKDASDSPTKKLKAGETFNGKGYSIVVPQGWESMHPTPPATEVAFQMAGNPQANINILSTKIPIANLDELLPHMKTALGGQAENLTELPRIKVAGTESVGLTGKYKNGGYLMDQRYVVKDGNLYIITMVSVDPAKDSAGRTGLSSLLSSWKFA